ncbi:MULTISPECIES: MerR family transcriptional regulator [Stenotrophomonas]|jgi:DNA-binding transcriptional MerR regulator|uniref:MerR family transcriptional regulator n=1 Tax=Stenotrophomonas TaxID=40323 RepID=UPI000390208E|nr:helix-turn-helix domain-containing protein [Stenotrophomonas maltophilia]EQM88010.1 MerR family transcriptional regulator [Stenotrophomonas maltophilia MF89]OHY71867.1 MerR family transcriptional regulator [Stenotrophomonas maltophilia]UUS13699.1 helix-turn-helix domain-containing protein [Stenotrophomonas sp. CD2]
MSEIFTIGQLARETGTKAETIRYYEKIGLLEAPARSGGNYRHYGQAARRRLAFVRRARELGFSIEQIRELIAFGEQAEHQCSSVDEVVKTHIDDIKRKVSDLLALQVELQCMLANCSGGRVADCRVLGALQPARATAS